MKKIKLNPNCSEQVFRLKGSLDEIKKEVLKMLDTIRINYRGDGVQDSWYKRTSKEITKKKRRVKEIQSMKEFEDIIFPFSCNYETYFRVTDDETLDVATCNNHPWDDVNYYPLNEDYGDVAGYEYYTVEARGRHWVYLTLEFEEDNKRGYPKSIALEPVDGRTLYKKDLKGYTWTKSLDMKIRMSGDKKFYWIHDSGDEIIQMRKVTDKKKLRKINDIIMVGRI